MARKIVSTIFCILLFLFFISTAILFIPKFIGATLKLKNKEINLKMFIKEAKPNFSEASSLHHFFLDFFGLSRKLLHLDYMFFGGIVKDNNNMLFLVDENNYSIISPKIDQKKLDEMLSNISTINSFLKEKNISFLYVEQPPRYNKNWTKFNIPLTDYSHENTDIFLKSIENIGIKTVDMRKYQVNDDYFYKTDHHYRTESTFLSNIKIIEACNELFGIELDPTKEKRQLENYTIKTYKKRFMGSYGIKTSIFYTSKDDFTLITPNFDTLFSFYRNNNEKIDIEEHGSFSETLVNTNLFNSSYVNVYNSYLYGSLIENIIENKKSENNLKCLLIADSFGRPLAPFLSLNFMETRFLDPQEGRFNNNMLEYISQYNPNIVIMMFNGNIVYVPSNIK